MQTNTITNLGINSFIEHISTEDFGSSKRNNKSQFHICKLDAVDYSSLLQKAFIYDFYTIYFIDEGFIDKTNQINTVKILKKELFFSIPGEILKWNKLKELKGYLLCFSKEFLMMLIGNANLINTFEYLAPSSSRKFRLDGSNYEIFKDIIDDLEAEYSRPSKYSEELIRFKIFEMMIKLNRLFLGRNEETQRFVPVKSCDIIYTNFIQLVEETYKKLALGQIQSPLLVKEYASLLNINPTYLGECVRSASGTSAKSIINKRTLLLAKCQLLHTGNNISEIAYQIGFESSGYFIRFFKKFENTTPLEFRRQHTLFA